MDKTKRIFINTISQYLRTVVCMLLSLYTTRIVLEMLGKSDFGIYSLIGSIVLMLGFITTSLSTSTQRFLSYSWGKDDINETKAIFSNAMSLHIFICLVIAIVMIAIERPLIHGYLKIDPSRLDAADFVYYVVVFILSITFITAPVKAIFIARENIVFSSLVDVVDGFIKLGGAIGLSWITIDTLKAYAILMASISILSLLVYLVYGLTQYEECHIPRFSELSRKHLKHLLNFAVWNVYSVGSTIIRTQGLSVIINRFFSTLINASYGIAMQISGSVSSIAGAIINSINPQLMKAEGRGDRTEMLRLTTMESKFSYLILSTLLIPLIVELPSVLTFWLKDYPAYSVQFCSLIMVSIIFDQTTIGLTSANQAIGNIRNYSLLISTIRLLILPSAWLCLYYGLPVYSVMVVYLCVEVLCGLTRIPFLKHTAGLIVADYCKDVYIKTAPPVLGNILISIVISLCLDFSWRFLLTEFVGIITSILLIYSFSLSINEKQWIKSRIHTKLHIK